MSKRCHIEDETGVRSEFPSFEAAEKWAKREWAPGVEVVEVNENLFEVIRPCFPRNEIVAQIIVHRDEEP